MAQQSHWRYQSGHGTKRSQQIYPEYLYAWERLACERAGSTLKK